MHISGPCVYNREMVRAMQDPEAGIKMTQFGPKRGRTVTKYFAGGKAGKTCVSLL